MSKLHFINILTQADLVKESIVVIDNICKKRGYDLVLHGTVHDELIYSHPIGYKVLCPLRKEVVDAGDFIAHIMKEVSNLYLDGVEMGAEYHTMKTWTK